jgi:sarcosine oxidase gamma subunit
VRKPNYGLSVLSGKPHYFEKTGLRKLLWQTPDRYYIISANISEEDILKVAKSLGK